MTALALTFQRNGEASSRSVIDAMLAAQAYRGSDGTYTCVDDCVGLGLRAMRTLPEDAGIRYPLSIPGAPFQLLWHGRIDNREELLRALTQPPADAAACSDAELFLCSYAERGTDTLRRIVGAFALVLHDSRRHTVLLARDAMGHRDLNYHLRRDVLVAATQESGVLAHPGVGRQLNPQRLAGHLGITGTHDGATFYTDITKLLPGHYMVVGLDSVVIERYWQPDTTRRIHYRDDREYAEHFRELLELAVTCRNRAADPIGVMTSGGLDSGPIAAIAGSHADGRRPVYSLSWTFEHYPECDEREYLRPLWNKYALQPLEINCDNEAPYSDLRHWPVHPDNPDQDPYRRFLDKTYDTAAASGVRVILNGGAGDNLYLSGDFWFWALLRSGRLARALEGARWYIGEAGLRRFARTILVRSLVPAAVISKLRPRRFPQWMTDEAVALVRDQEPWPPERRRALRPAQCALLLSLRTADFLTAEDYWCGMHGVEVRYPMRDRRLVEFMLQVPDHQLRFKDLNRPILRNAVSDLLPEAQRNRTDKTVFSPLFRRGAAEHHETIRRLLEDPDALWPRFLRRDWLLGDDAPTQVVAETLKWTALSVELWRTDQQLQL